MISSLATSEPRVLSDAEIAMVAGGPHGSTSAITSLINNNNYYYMTNDQAFMESNGYVFADYNQDGAYDNVWQVDGNGGWLQSTDGIHWYHGTDANDEWLAWAAAHGWHVVEG